MNDREIARELFSKHRISQAQIALKLEVPRRQVIEWTKDIELSLCAPIRKRGPYKPRQKKLSSAPKLMKPPKPPKPPKPVKPPKPPKEPKPARPKKAWNEPRIRQDVVDLYLSTQSVEEVASKLGISVRTVLRHTRECRPKLRHHSHGWTGPDGRPLREWYEDQPDLAISLKTIMYRLRLGQDLQTAISTPSTTKHEALAMARQKLREIAMKYEANWSRTHEARAV